MGKSSRDNLIIYIDIHNLLYKLMFCKNVFDIPIQLNISINYDYKTILSYYQNTYNPTSIQYLIIKQFI